MSIPFIGSKKSIAKYIIDIIPPAENYYDLFGGGAAISEVALQAGKWSQVHYNEINTEIVNVIRWLSHDYDTAVQEITKLYLTPIDRQDFFRIKNKQERTPIDTLALIVYSFGNDRSTYLWCKEKEAYKIPIVKQLAADIIKNGVRFPDFKKYRINWLKENKIYRESNRIGTEIESLQSLSSLENLQRLERLQALERMESLERQHTLNITNLDYRDVEIKPDSIVYCDIPYYNAANKYGNDFNHDYFYNWVRNAEFPVYYSGYDTDAGGFDRVWEKEHTCKLAKKGGKELRRVECLYKGGRQ